MRALVTGLDGFAGRHLGALLLERGDEAARRCCRAGPRPRGEALAAVPRHVVDVRDAAAVAAAVAATAPTCSSTSPPAPSCPRPADPAAAFAVNALGTLHVLAAVARHAPRCRGAGGRLGRRLWRGRGGQPADRQAAPLRPLSAYGASKAAADLVAGQWAEGMGLDVVGVL
ncbi:MAG: NAD(P)-dependent oxidoreductase [Candidatus Binatia bacterium]